jgi:hypothetical protein
MDRYGFARATIFGGSPLRARKVVLRLPSKDGWYGEVVQVTTRRHRDGGKHRGDLNTT